MTAYRVVDDHKDLDNIGTVTHDQIDSHVNTSPFVIVSGVVGNIPSSARLLSGSGISITDGGPGGNLTLTVTGGGSATPAGNDTEIQFNDGGAFGSDSNFVFNKTTNTLTVSNLSGSLTRLADGSSYLIAGQNVTIVTGTNGSVTISSTASGGGGGSGDPDATYLVLSTTSSLNNERALSPGVGLSATDGGSGGNYSLFIDDSVVATVSGATFTGVTKHLAGLSGSLTRLADGTSYLRAGNNITITSASNGSITINSTASGTGAPGGDDTQVQFNDGGSFGGDANFTFNRTTNTLSVSNLSGSLTRLTDGSPYLIAGSNVTITSSSNGSVVISSAASSTTTNFLTSWMEIPAGDVDGVNMIYSLSNVPYPANSVWFYVNGVLQLQGPTLDYTVTGNEITMNYSPTGGSNLFVTYAYVDTTVYGSFTKWVDFVTGSANGSNTAFTLGDAPNPADSLMLYVNGILQRSGSSHDYTIAGNSITMNYAPSAESALVASYKYTITQQTSSINWTEVPSGEADGANFTFSVANTPIPSSSLMFFVNGVLQKQGALDDYTVTGNSIFMNYAPNSGSNILATYPY